MRIGSPLLLSCLGLCLAAPAAAQTALNLNAGTWGIGAGLVLPINEASAFRLGLAGDAYRTRIRESDVRYRARVELAHAPLLFDWHPGAGAFRLTAGIVPNNDNADLEARTTDGVFRFNGTAYDSSTVGSVTGRLSFDRRVAPYLGAGFALALGGPNSGWNWSMDFGLMYMGKLKATLSATCTSTASAAQCAQLQSDVAAETDQLRDSANDLRWYPVIQVNFAKWF